MLIVTLESIPGKEIEPLGIVKGSTRIRCDYTYMLRKLWQRLLMSFIKEAFLFKLLFDASEFSRKISFSESLNIPDAQGISAVLRIWASGKFRFYPPYKSLRNDLSSRAQ